jgi:hypothetical protein
MITVFVSFVLFVVDNSNPYITADACEMNHKAHKEHKERAKDFALWFTRFKFGRSILDFQKRRPRHETAKHHNAGDRMADEHWAPEEPGKGVLTGSSHIMRISLYLVINILVLVIP